MSNTNVQALAPEAAFATVHNRVYAPCFFTKLARDYGISPNQYDDPASAAQQMLSMAAQLRAAHDQQVKAAAAGGKNMLDAASAHLQGVLNSAGFQFPSAEEELIKRASAEVALDPEIAHAVLSLQTAAAQA